MTWIIWQLIQKYVFYDFVSSFILISKYEWYCSSENSSNFPSCLSEYLVILVHLKWAIAKTDTKSPVYRKDKKTCQFTHLP